MRSDLDPLTPITRPVAVGACPSHSRSMQRFRANIQHAFYALLPSHQETLLTTKQLHGWRSQERLPCALVIASRWRWTPTRLWSNSRPRHSPSGLAMVHGGGGAAGSPDRSSISPTTPSNFRSVMADDSWKARALPYSVLTV